MALMDPECPAKFLNSTSTYVSSQRCRLRSTLVVEIEQILQIVIVAIVIVIIIKVNYNYLKKSPRILCANILKRFATLTILYVEDCQTTAR